MIKTQPRLVNIAFPDATTLQMEVPTAHKWPHALKKLRDYLKPGVIITLSGPLGAGKTTLVQALAHSLGIIAVPPSPTFALMRSYELPTAVNKIKRLLHVDAYRLEDERDVRALDLDEELADEHTLLLIEWPEKIPRFIKKHNVIKVVISL